MARLVFKITSVAFTLHLLYVFFCHVIHDYCFFPLMGCMLSFGLQFVSDVTKYISGCMASLSAMIQLELPHINVLTKVDLLPNKRDIDR